jgi:rhodanese-related sulfurtransferase
VGGEKNGREEGRSAAMKQIFSAMSRNAKLGLLVCLLGLLAAFAGNPYKGSKVTLDTAELAEIVQNEVDHVEPSELADWIIQGRTDYRLIDLRREEEFNQYHIPGAENVSLTSLLNYSLRRNDKIILYSGGGIHSAQAWFLLKAQGYKAVYMLFGGLDEWQYTVLFPSIPSNPSPEQQAFFNKMKEVSKFFGGSPRVGADEEITDAPLSLPEIQQPPVSPAAPAAVPARRKRKEGC